ncbi:MAG: Rieske (2Fe-2S) protein [Anaerolineae bacterium]
MSDDRRNEEMRQVSRRTMLTAAWSAAGALLLTESALIGLRFLAPRVISGEFGGVFTVGAVDDFPPGSVTPVEAGRFYLVRMPDGGFLALYRRCTHLGCAVPYDPAQGRFVCPCHGSEFEQSGQVLNPPAPRPLDRFPVSFEDGMVLVDTGRPIERDRTDPGDLAYA